MVVHVFVMIMVTFTLLEIMAVVTITMKAPMMKMIMIMIMIMMVVVVVVALTTTIPRLKGHAVGFREGYQQQIQPLMWNTRPAKDLPAPKPKTQNPRCHT